MAERVPAWLADPALSRLWDAARARLERNFLEASGRIVLTGLDRDERHAIGALLGRSVVADRITVDLAEFDSVVARRSRYSGLADLVVAVSGGPLRDRRAERSSRAAARARPFEIARELIGTSGRLVGAPWVEPWLGDLRRSGLLTRAGADAEQVMRRAVAVLDAVLDSELPGQVANDDTGVRSETPSRVDLAATIVGDAHALDDGTVLAQAVLRGLAFHAGIDPPDATAARRELWERFGVAVDSVSSTCLTVGITARNDDVHGRRLTLAAKAGDPVHLTPWDLQRIEPAAPPAVLVCENPRVLEAVAQRHGGSVPAVCTAGQPALVVLDVLRRLGEGGATLHYHGDFDWPGIAIANRLVDQAGVVPWMMNATDYLEALQRAPASLALIGTPVAARWDARLTQAMADHGAAIHEEAVLDEILRSAPGLARR